MAVERPRALITYDGLPVSAGGAHRIRARNRVATWERMLGFLTSFTTYDEPDDVRLLLAEGPRVDAVFFDSAHRRATAAFGPSGRRIAVSGAVNEHEHRWTLTAADLNRSLELMDGLEPFPRHWLDAPLVLSIGAEFRLRDPDSGAVFAAQEPELYGFQTTDGERRLGLSRIHLRLTATSTCSLFLSLPFPDVDPELREYVRRIDGSLPFRLSRRHWSGWRLNARGTRYSSRRVSVLDGSEDNPAN